MTRIKGITVTLFHKEQIGIDAFNAPIYDEIPIDVDNVLVTPTSSDEIINAQNLYGKHAVYTLGIPKGNCLDWENAYVEFFDKRFKVFGSVTQGIDDLIPLDWNMKVMVERIE